MMTHSSNLLKSVLNGLVRIFHLPMTTAKRIDLEIKTANSKEFPADNVSRRLQLQLT